jgi:predicted phosphodiesterase
VRVAVIADVHGNAPALEAVLAEVERERVDLVVDLGDLLAGPLPAETMALVDALGDRIVHVSGNGDRELVAAFDAPGAASELPPAVTSIMGYAAGAVDRAARDALAAFPPTLVLDVDGLGPTCFCHATPRSDVEIVPADSPDERVAGILAAVEQDVVVAGHTHMRLDRRVGRHRVLNPGSVGMPYEGRPGAFWAVLGPDVEFRETAYDLEAAAARIRAAGYPAAESFVAENLFAPPGPDAVVPDFEART